MLCFRKIFKLASSRGALATGIATGESGVSGIVDFVEVMSTAIS